MEGSSFIDGVWIDGATPFATHNPSDLDDVVGSYAASSLDDGEAALAAARAALPAWRDHAMQSRSDLLRTAADLLFARRQEIGTLLSREEGKTLAEGIGEAERAAQLFRYFSAAVLGARGEWYDSMRAGHNILVSREPVGVVAAITPWNFPIALPAWKVAAALAFGNTVVLKPSSFVPGCAIMLARVLAEAGLPPGVFNLVLGDSLELGRVLIGGADAVTFTGSTENGRNVLAVAAQSMTKCQLELGGKNALAVLDDADLDLAVEIAANGAWIQTGQRCTASERIVVTKGIHDAFVERLGRKAKGYKVGHALDPGTEIGPVANAPQFAKNEQFIRSARDEGAELIAGGEPVAARTRGLYLAPTLFAGTRSEMRCNQQEAFGPIACIIKVDDLDEALAVVNSTELALSAGVATRNLRDAEHFRKNCRAGMVMINAPTAGAEYHVPLGGRTPSGYGPRECGSASEEFFTETKTTYIHHGA